MLVNLSFEDALCHIAVERRRDDLASHMLLCVPDSEAWAVINLRNPMEIAIAVARPDMTPACFVAAVEFEHWRDATVPEKMETVLLHLLSRRRHSGLLVNLLEVWSIAHNTQEYHGDPDDIPEQLETVPSDDGLADEGGESQTTIDHSEPCGKVLHPENDGGTGGVANNTQSKD